MCNNTLGCVVRELIIYSKGNLDTCKSAPVTKIFLDCEIRLHLISDRLEELHATLRHSTICAQIKMVQRVSKPEFASESIKL
jgi:hypothetical protein